MQVAFGGTVPEGFGAPKPQFEGPEQVLDDSLSHRVRLTTTAGDITIELFSQEAPVTANSFAFLASQGFYDATLIHRVIPGFVVQMGDPLGNGTGGPGYSFDDELAAARNRGYKRGTVAMANAGPHTNGSQIFICLADDILPPKYNVFGEVVEGMDSVDRIASLPTDERDLPREAVFIERAALLDG